MDPNRESEVSNGDFEDMLIELNEDDGQPLSDDLNHVVAQYYDLDTVDEDNGGTVLSFDDGRVAEYDDAGGWEEM